MKPMLRWIALCLLLLPPGAHAADGVIEINQASALVGGVSAGDTPGFPVTLAAGSYLLTSDLVPPPDIRAINGVASNVRLNLAGFARRRFSAFIAAANSAPPWNDRGRGGALARRGLRRSARRWMRLASG